jgi:hypothetical protein
MRAQLASVSAEVHNGWLQLPQLSQQIQWLYRPPSYELEPIALSAPLELGLDLSGFFA